MATKSQVAAAEVVALLRARNPLIWIVTREEKRAEGYVAQAAMATKYVPRYWDVAQGLTTMDGGKDNLMSGEDRDLGFVLSFIGNRGAGGERSVWILRDVAPWIKDLIGAPSLRQLRNLAHKLPNVPRDSAQAIIVMSATADVPPELADEAKVINWPLPDREEIGEILDRTLSKIDDAEARVRAIDGNREAAIDAAMGLTEAEIESCFAKSLVTRNRTIDPATVVAEKKQLIARERVLSWSDPVPGGLAAVGGLDNLKAWLTTRQDAYTAEARAYGLPAPRGAFLVGVSGCGKSLIAKTVASAWMVPLIRLDLNALKSKFVGDSEGNVRRVLATIDAVGRCVVLIDEIEKALAGATQGAADGGVSSDALGTFLTWAQEREGEAFIVATANDIGKLPPELMRKGRFDDIWFVDLPIMSERADIVIAALTAHKRRHLPIDFVAVAKASEGFTGAEVAELVPSAMYAAFADGKRDITTEDLIAAARDVAPLSKTKAGEIAALREWSKGKARPATTRETMAPVSNARVVDDADFEL